MELAGKVAIVTGGTRGIGRAIASSLVKAGVQVAITARREQDLAQATSQLNQHGRAAGYVCDVRDYDQVKSTFARIAEDFGGVDILVNNAGIGIFASVESMSVEDFRAVLETNVFGVFYCCHEAIPLMKQRGGGYIINISSLAGANPHPNMAAYNASKFGLNGFSEALMQEVRHDGIKVSYIMPGSVNTEFGGDEPSDAKAGNFSQTTSPQVVMDLLEYPDRALPSRVEIRPSRPPKKMKIFTFLFLASLLVINNLFAQEPQESPELKEASALMQSAAEAL